MKMKVLTNPLLTIQYLLLLLSSVNGEDYSHSTLPNLSPISTRSDLALTASWEFKDNNLHGWGAASSSEMQAEVMSVAGEMRIIINGDEPSVDSPRLKIATPDRYAVALKYRYVGPSTVGKIRLRGNEDPDSYPAELDPSLITWEPKLGNTDYFRDIYYPIIGDGQWRTTYASFQVKEDGILDRTFDETLTQMRLYPATFREEKDEDGNIISSSVSPIIGNAFHVDWIRLVSSPVITRVTGCNGEKYASTFDFTTNNFEVFGVEKTVNEYLHYFSTDWIRRRLNEFDTTFAKSYNCLRSGGELLTIEGRNFGLGGVNGKGAPAKIFIGSNPCTNVIHDEASPQSKLTCITPPMGDEWSDSDVIIKHGKLPGLNDTVSYFNYALPPPVTTTVLISNVATHSIDLTWGPGGSIWDAMSVTGYVINWRLSSSTTWDNEMIVGNITTTTVTNLQPDTLYDFGVSPISEDKTMMNGQRLINMGVGHYLTVD